MSVTTTVNRAEYTGNGAQTVFTYPFKIFENSDLHVLVAGVLKTLTTDYTVAGAGNDLGGEITFLSAPANGASVVLLRVLPATQETVYPSNDKFPAKVHEGIADRAVCLVQQLQETDQRALKLSISSLFRDLGVPDPVDGKFLRWNSLLTALENADVVALGGIGLPVAVADGGTGATSALNARINLGLDGQVTKQLTNRTGGSVAAGDVVALSTANDDSVVLEDTQGSKAIFAIALEAVSNLAVGKFLIRGVADVAVQGAASRGAYLRKSATSLKVESTGTTHGAAVEPPVTSLGVTIGDVSGGKARSIWWGVAFPSAATSTVPPGVISFGVIANGTDATNDIDIPAIECSSDDTVPANRVWLVGTAMTKQLDIAWAAGTNAGGRISGEAIANGTWYIYEFKRSGGAIDYCFSQSLTPTLPDGGTSKRLIFAFVRVGGAIKAFDHDGRTRVDWKTPVLDVNNAAIGSGTRDTITLTVPTGIRVIARINARITHASARRVLYVSSLAQTDDAVTADGAAAPVGTVHSLTGGPQAQGPIEVITNTSGQIGTRTDGAGATQYIATAGYELIR